MDEQCEKWDISPELRYQPVSEWLKRWLDDCRESIAESTLVRYTAVVRHACQFFDEKGLALCRVSPMAMEEYRDAMLACGYSARTIQMHFKLLQTAFTAACSYGLNRSNPICGVQLPRVERDIPRPYSAAEQQKLLEELKGPPASSRTARAPVRHASAVAFLIECRKIAEYQADFRTYRLLS